MGEARLITSPPKRDTPPIPAMNWAPPEVSILHSTQCCLVLMHIFFYCRFTRVLWRLFCAPQAIFVFNIDYFFVNFLLQVLPKGAAPEVYTVASDVYGLSIVLAEV